MVSWSCLGLDCDNQQGWTFIYILSHCCLYSESLHFERAVKPYLVLCAHISESICLPSSSTCSPALLSPATCPDLSLMACRWPMAQMAGWSHHHSRTPGTPSLPPPSTHPDSTHQASLTILCHLASPPDTLCSVSGGGNTLLPFCQESIMA